MPGYNRIVQVLAFAALVAAVMVVADARIFHSQGFKTKNNWQYIAKFCFNGAPGGVNGLINWNIPTEQTSARQLLLYWDQPNKTEHGSWYAVYKNKALNCNEKTAFSATGADIYLKDHQTGTTSPKNSYPHYWWAVLADCNTSTQAISGYTIEFLNHGGSHLSCDEQGLPSMYIVFFTFFLIMVAIHIFSVVQLYKTESLHPIIRLVTVCLGFQIWSMLFYMIYYTTLQRNGISHNGVKAFGDLFNMAMDLSLIALIILVSKGWAVTTNVIPKRDTAIILVTMVLLIILYLALFIWDYATAGGPITYYFYQSAPGVIILVLRMLVAFWFFWNIWQTLKLETLPEKRSFYIRWVIIFGSWLMLLPAFVLIIGSQHVWLRLKAISALSEVVDFIVLAALVFMTWPSLARHYFSVMPGKTLLGYDFLSGESSSYAGAANPANAPPASNQNNPFNSSSDL